MYIQYARRRPCSQAYIPICVACFEWIIMHSSSEKFTWTSTRKAITIKPFTNQGCFMFIKQWTFDDVQKP